MNDHALPQTVGSHIEEFVRLLRRDYSVRVIGFVVSSHVAFPCHMLWHSWTTLHFQLIMLALCWKNFQLFFVGPMLNSIVPVGTFT